MDHLDDEIRARVVLIGGKVSGVDCPACQFRTRERDLDGGSVTDVVCPECEHRILTEEQMSQLRQADKLRWPSC